MKIYSLSRVLAFPFVVALALLAYLEFVEYKDIGWWLLPPLMAIVVLIILNGEIDYWYLKKKPIPLDPRERSLLVQYVPFYNKLSPSEKKKFEDRVSLYVGAREWKNVGTADLKEIPDDVKSMIAAQSIQLTFYDKDFLLGDYDRIYTYKHPFPSPRFKFLHTVETNAEDGMIIYSMDHALPGISSPYRFYNVVMHGYAEAYIRQNPQKNYPNVNDTMWEQIALISGFGKEQILSTLGFEQINLQPLLLNFYFTFPVELKQHLPEVFASFKQIFTMDKYMPTT